jgi:aldose sugar dehydrogenase
VISYPVRIGRAVGALAIAAAGVACATSQYPEDGAAGRPEVIVAVEPAASAPVQPAAGIGAQPSMGAPMQPTAGTPTVGPPAAGTSAQTPSYRVVTVLEGLDYPWSIAFLPGGDILVAERTGKLRLARNGRIVVDSVHGLPPIRVGGQGGMAEIVAHPDFASNRMVYFTLAKPNEAGNQSTTALYRARFENDRLNNVQEIFEARAWSTGAGHYGAKIAFDGRGHLFLSVGDRQAAPRGDLESHPAQSLMDHQGTIVRLHEDGRVPADNPFVGRTDALPEIWSYGHRNPQGLVYDHATGNLWSTEHGPQGGDELNLVLPGRNYGWPVIGYGVNYGAARTPVHDTTHRAGMEQPVHYWVPSIAASGLMLYTGDRFPQWRGNLFAGGLAGEQIARLVMDGRRVVSEETIFAGRGRIRDIRQGPDGYIYVAMDGPRGRAAPDGKLVSVLVRLEPAQR